MEYVQLYYYAGIPLITCNMLLYSMSTISSSITSSQNVVKFISEHKDCDSILFKKELENTDIQNKLEIVDALIRDIVKNHCQEDEYEQICNYIRNSQSCHVEEDCSSDDNKGDFAIIHVKTSIPTTFDFDIEEPVKMAIMSTAQIVSELNDDISKISGKIIKHKQSFFTKLLSISLKSEMASFTKHVRIFEQRMDMLFRILNVYK